MLYDFAVDHITIVFCSVCSGLLIVCVGHVIPLPVSWSHDLISWSRDAVPWSRDLISWSRDVVSRSRDLLSWSRDAVSRSHDSSTSSWDVLPTVRPAPPSRSSSDS